MTYIPNKNPTPLTREDIESLKKHVSPWYAAMGHHIEATLVALTAERDEAVGELRSIDSVLARRPALDKPTRVENIEHAINTAKRADTAEARETAAEKALAKLTHDNTGCSSECVLCEEIRNYFAAPRLALEATEKRVAVLEAEVAAYRNRDAVYAAHKSGDRTIGLGDLDEVAHDMERSRAATDVSAAGGTTNG